VQPEPDELIIKSSRARFDSLFDSFRREFDDMMNMWWPITPLAPQLTRPAARPLMRVGYPITDIEDNGDSYMVTADLPGFTKDKVNIKGPARP
jgi:HSP20 family molecular chaperone IbpA